MPDFRPKKRFGQNFLTDNRVVEKILAAAEPAPSDRILEIGPGLGVLTERLLPRVAEVRVMELDRELAAWWQARAASNLFVYEGDALRLDWPALLPHPPYKMVANLPYNISSQVLFKILDHQGLFSRLVLMFQKEVGERLLAPPGNKDYGVLSVLGQTWFDINLVAKVPPGAFSPPPRVDSAVLAFEVRHAPRVPVPDPEFFRQVVKGAFSQRRKTLRNSLTGAGLGREGLENRLREADIDPGRRAETLSLEEFSRLARILSGASI